MQTTEQKFWKKVDRRGPDECWPWLGCRDKKWGYGRFTIGGKEIGAHRYSWKLVNGFIEDGLFILHSCDNPPCCNPAHLRPGTHIDNMEDMKSRGRSTVGESNPHAKMTWEKVKEIRARYIPRVVTMKKLAAEYGVTDMAINYVVHNKLWIKRN
jgi:hypothetical protein